MPGYHERLRDMENTRWLMRDFLIYGFRTRNDQRLSSARTYDNERHRIESLLGDTLQWRQAEGGRQYFISADASALAANPLHRIWRLRTFTDNDLLLHACLLAELNPDAGISLEELSASIAQDVGMTLDDQTLRRKLREYAALGIVRTEKDGKRSVYALSDVDWERLFPDDAGVEEMLAFFRETLPLGSLADGMLMREDGENRFIRFKHHFLMHTLDDDVLLSLLEAMHDGQAVRLTVERQKEAAQYAAELLPVCIRISEETGRRYLIGYDMQRGAARGLRLDLIRSLKRMEPPEDAPGCAAQVRAELERCWGISLPHKPDVHHLEMDVRIALPEESFVLDRLRREGRGGRVTQMEQNLFRYAIDVTDTMEMMPWIRTFTGRIVSLRDDSGQAERRFREDMARMRTLYAAQETEAMQDDAV